MVIVKESKKDFVFRKRPIPAETDPVPKTFIELGNWFANNGGFERNTDLECMAWKAANIIDSAEILIAQLKKIQAEAEKAGRDAQYRF